MIPYSDPAMQQPQQAPQPQNVVGQQATMAPGQSPLSYQQAMAQALQNSGQVASSAPNLSGVMQMMQMMKKQAGMPSTAAPPSSTVAAQPAATSPSPFDYPPQSFGA